MVSVWAQSSGSADSYVDGLLEAENLTLPFYWRAYYREAPLLVAVKIYSGNNSWLVIPSITSLNLFESWKCINREESDWHKLSFRDSHWKTFHLIYINTPRPGRRCIVDVLSVSTDQHRIQ